MPDSPSYYVHGTAPDEQRRLSTLNDLLNATSLREMGLTPGLRVLDVGSGLGQLTRGIARVVGPTGHVLGIERSPDQIAEAMRQAREAGEESLLDVRQGDAIDPPLRAEEWGSFDLAHARFVVEHVNDPLRVVRAMVRAVRPGGRVILEDDDHDVARLYPEPAGWRELWDAYMETYAQVGNDPIVGRRLTGLLHEAGAPAVRNTWIFFGGCAGEERFPLLVANVLGLLRSARRDLLKTGRIAELPLDAAFAAIAEWGERPDAALWFGRCWAEGVKKA
jgi:SAM-dependent methyltransferase